MEGIDLGGYQRETLVLIAKLAEETKRYDEMAMVMNLVAIKAAQLSPNERKLLGVAYRSAVVSRRASWAILSQLEKESTDDLLKLKAVQKIKLKIETEIARICEEILSIIDGHLIPSTDVADASMLFYTLKGDHHTYLAGIKNDAERQEDVESARRAYEAATNIAENYAIPVEHPDLLHLRLSSGIFYHEIMNQPLRAYRILDDAHNEVELCENAFITRETRKAKSVLDEKWLQLFSELWTN